jgi:hypothetical protein
MTVEGVDYSFSRPGGAALVKAGKKFAYRYLPYSIGGSTDNGKGLTASEIKDLHDHGIAIGINFEWYAGRMKRGAGAGTTDGQAVLAAYNRLGIPRNVPCIFSADWDTTSADYPAIDAYLRAAGAVLGGASRVGIYGEANLIDHIKASGSAKWFWQTYAWSGGRTASGIHVKQYLNSQSINGGSVDLDRSYQSDWGQWAPVTTLPDTGIEGATDMGLNLDLDVTHDSNPFDALGTASIVGDGHFAERLDGTGGIAIAAGTALGVVQKAKIASPAPSWAALGEACVVYNLSGKAYVSPVRDIGATYKPLTDTSPYTQAQLDAATSAAALAAKAADAAAIAALQAKVDALLADAAKSAGVERSRIAAAEAARINAL